MGNGTRGPPPLGGTALYRWMTGARDRGVWDLVDQEWVLTTHADLEAAACRAATGMRDRGVQAGDRVMVSLDPSSSFVATLFGAWFLGAAIVPLAPPEAVVGAGSGRGHVERAARAAAARLHVVTDGDEGDGPIPEVAVGDLLACSADVAPRPPGEAVVLQMTSGSTGPPKAVQVTRGSLEAQVAALGAWLGWTADDFGAMWLPTHHDMGLVSLLAALSHRSDARLMRPGDFVRRPLTWLRCAGDLGMTIAPSTMFALNHIVRRVRPDQLEGMDFSRWRALIVGAERVDPEVVRRFVALLAPFGFSPLAVRPAYGMAETTLAVTAVSMGEPLRARTPGPAGQAVDIVTATGATGAEAPGAVTSSGRAVTGTTVTIRDEAGAEVADGEVGEVVVSGSSVTAGYVVAGSLVTAFGGEVATGDLGFLADGELYVLGRAGDSLNLHGRVVMADDIEIAVGSVPGVPAHRFCVLVGEGAGPPTTVVVHERDLPDGIPAVVRSVTGPLTDVHLVRVRRGAILRTTSGKPRRRELWQRYLRGELEVPSPAPTHEEVP